MRSYALVPTAILALLAGCAGRQEVTVLAGRTSAILNDYRRDMSTFAQEETVLRQDNQRRLRNIAEMGQQHDANVTRVLLGWQLANERDATALYGLATQAQAETIASASEALRMAQSTPLPVEAVRFDSAQVEAVISRLRAVGRPQSFWDRLGGAVGYGRALRDAYHASLQKAAGEAASAVTSASDNPLPGSSPSAAPASSPNR